MEQRYREQRMDRLLERAWSIVGQLTLDEKIGMIHGAQLFQNKGVERLKISPLKTTDGTMGVRQEFQPGSWIPAGDSDDYVTYLPCSSALASTWDRELALQAGSVLGAETRGRGKDVILAPGINIKRSPLCGRNFEYFSEDPFLTKELAVPFVRGIQQWDVAACVKHFAVNNQETERLWVDVQIDEETLRRIYLPAFHDVLVRGGAYAVMAAYERVNGEHCYCSRHLLADILRKEWGYDGMIVSDWGGVHDTELAARSPLDLEMSVTFDFDQYFMAEPLKEKIRKGEIDEGLVDEKVVHILLLMMRLHMLPEEGERTAAGTEEDERTEAGTAEDGQEVSCVCKGGPEHRRERGAYDTEEHRQTALKVAQASVVLLKNDKGQLPLSVEKDTRLLVIGDNGERLHAAGGGSAEVKALYEISPLMGIKKLLGGGGAVDYLRGYCRDKDLEDKEQGDEAPESKVSWQASSLKDGGGHTKASPGDTKEEQHKAQALAEKRRALRQRAVDAAAAPDYDQVIFIGGLDHEYDCEGNDRADMKLPYEQDLLIRELFKVRPDMIVVMVGGSPVEMGQWIGQAHSLVWSWYAGMEGGTALAQVLFGQVNPSGKLPESFYKTHMDCSAHCLGEFPGGEKVHYKEGVLVGYRYLDTCSVEPAFCFGHGLSYTTFTYADGSISKRPDEEAAERGEGGSASKSIQVTLKVTNTGTCAGAEVVQIYLRMPKGQEPETRREDMRRTDGGMDRPGRTYVYQELKGFEKVFLEPGEQKKVTVTVEDYEKGCQIAVGSSSRDIRIIL